MQLYVFVAEYFLKTNFALYFWRKYSILLLLQSCKFAFSKIKVNKLQQSYQPVKKTAVVLTAFT